MPVIQKCPVIAYSWGIVRMQLYDIKNQYSYYSINTRWFIADRVHLTPWHNSLRHTKVEIMNGTRINFISQPTHEYL